MQFYKVTVYEPPSLKFVLDGRFFPWSSIKVFTMAVLQNTSECFLFALVIKKILNQNIRNKIYFKTNFFVRFLSLF